MVDESVKSAFETSLSNAESVIGKDDATVEELNNANKALQENIKAVEIEKSKYEIIKKKLIDNIAYATELTTAEDFDQHATEDEQNNLSSKLEAATTINTAEKSTYTELNTSNTELESAIDLYINSIKSELKEYIDELTNLVNGEGDYAAYKDCITDDHKTQAKTDIADMETVYNNPSASKTDLVEEISKAETLYNLLQNDISVATTISATKRNLETVITKSETVKTLDFYPYFIQQNPDETKTAFESELDEAKEILNSYDSTFTIESVLENMEPLKEVSDKTTSLNNKRTSLISSQKFFVESFRPSIETDIDDANTLMSASDFADYSTEENRAAIKSATDNLASLYANNESYYSDLKTAETTLFEAISIYRNNKNKKQKEDLEAAKTSLNESVSLAENIKGNKLSSYATYPQFISDESKKTAFEKALEDAKNLQNNSSSMTIENCNSINNALKKAIDDIKAESDNYKNIDAQMKSTINTVDTVSGYSDFDKCSTEEKRNALSSALSVAKGLDNNTSVSDLVASNKALEDALNAYNADRSKTIEDLNATLSEKVTEMNNLTGDEYYPYFITGENTKSNLETTKANASSYLTDYLEDDGVISAREEIITNANSVIEAATNEKTAYNTLKDELGELITSATSVTSASDFADYSTEENREALTTALTEATNTNNDKTSSYKALSDIKTTLTNALSTYNTDKETSSAGGEELKTAKETLKTSIASANTIKENEYYPYFMQGDKDQENFEGVITYCQGIYDSNSSTVDQVKTANEAITNSINSMNNQITTFNNLRIVLQSNISQANNYVNAVDFDNYSTSTVRSNIKKYLPIAETVYNDKTSTYAQCLKAYQDLSTPLQTYTKAKVNS